MNMYLSERFGHHLVKQDNFCRQEADTLLSEVFQKTRSVARQDSSPEIAYFVSGKFYVTFILT